MKNLKILMLGNSFTSANNMPGMLAELTGAEVRHHTRGGARLAEQINPKTKMGARTLSALEDEKWNYVILQEMSKGPALYKEKFLQSAAVLCELIHAANAVPVFYATWAYKRGTGNLQKSGFSYNEMYRLMHEAYYKAAEQNQALIADVGKAFYEISEQKELYAEDGCHPNKEGSKLAAEIIARVVFENERRSIV